MDEQQQQQQRLSESVITEKFIFASEVKHYSHFVKLCIVGCLSLDKNDKTKHAYIPYVANLKNKCTLEVNNLFFTMTILNRQGKVKIIFFSIN